MTDLSHRPASPRSAEEPFTATGQPPGFKLVDFWRWQGSDLLSNTQRGILAEFIVAQALGGTTPVREEWSAFDVTTADGVTVEVKSSAKLQSWVQKAHSTIEFKINPTKLWDESTLTRASEARRHAQVYVFCVFAARDHAEADPLDLDQWEFYVLPTRVLNEKAASQGKIRLSSLQKLGPAMASYATLREAVLGAAR